MNIWEEVSATLSTPYILRHFTNNPSYLPGFSVFNWTFTNRTLNLLDLFIYNRTPFSGRSTQCKVSEEKILSITLKVPPIPFVNTKENVQIRIPSIPYSLFSE